MKRIYRRWRLRWKKTKLYAWWRLHFHGQRVGVLTVHDAAGFYRGMNISLSTHLRRPEAIHEVLDLNDTELVVGTDDPGSKPRIMVIKIMLSLLWLGILAAVFAGGAWVIREAFVPWLFQDTPDSEAAVIANMLMGGAWGISLAVIGITGETVILVSDEWWE